MSCNRFGTFLGLAHAAMTAEGDNSVLMQKVAKEQLGAWAKAGFKHNVPKVRILDPIKSAQQLLV